jgi:DNA-damage-inducible protein D
MTINKRKSRGSLSHSMNAFEQIRHSDEKSEEFWLARELIELLDYSEYRHFKGVIEKAKLACKNSGQEVLNHFEDILEMVQIGSGARKPKEDIRLSRYACYLIVQNGDPKKEIIALGQTYFAIQTRKHEQLESKILEGLNESQKRLFLRNELKAHNKNLAEAAKNAGVNEGIDFAIFQDHGYKGLYGGLGAKDIHKKKNLKKSQQILDYMGSTELAANLFRATQAEEKLKREKVKGKAAANKTHYEVGKKVRETIQDLGGTMPEELPTPEKSIKQLESKNKKFL